MGGCEIWVSWVVLSCDYLSVETHDKMLVYMQLRPKKKTKKDIDIFGDSELPWADPEKLVQLDEVVSMASHMNR